MFIIKKGVRKHEIEGKNSHVPLSLLVSVSVAVHLGVKMADTLSFTAKVDMVDFWV